MRPAALRERCSSDADSADQRDLEAGEHHRDSSADGNRGAVDDRHDDDRHDGDRLEAADDDVASPYVEEEPRHVDVSARDDVQEDGESCREAGSAAGAGDEEPRPAVQESRQPAVGVADENVLAARTRHQGRELGIRERPREAQQAANHPDRDHHARRSDVAGHHARLQEDAGSDDVAYQDRDGREQTQAAYQADFCRDGGSRSEAAGVARVRGQRQSLRERRWMER